MSVLCFFFLQAEDGIRDTSVTGVQTCALPISIDSHKRLVFALAAVVDFSRDQLFAGARLTRNEHRSLRWRDQVNLLDDLAQGDRKSTRLNSSHRCISYAVFCLKKKTIKKNIKK